MKKDGWRIIGAAGTIVYVVLFALHPNFPTPDKLIVFLTFLFMALGKARDMLKHLAPFIALLLVYESFRSIVPKLNSHVNYLWMPSVDRFLFHSLPTATLQNWLWQGHVTWYDYLIYGPYTLHFILPIGLAVLVWLYREKQYWQFVATYLVVSFAGFLTFLLFPAAPPWLASDMHLIQPITRVSSSIYSAMGIQNFPSVYNKLSPNPVAAVPSLHAAYATLLVIFVYKYFGKKWVWLPAIYAFVIFFGTVYTGEHYAIDEIIGIIYALVAYFGVDLWYKHKVNHKIAQAWRRQFAKK